MSALLSAHRRISESHAEIDDRHRCAWSSEMLAERCHYPGAMSHGTRGDGPWYCAGHFVCSDGAEGADIIALSRGYRPGDAVMYPARQERLQEAEKAAAETVEEPGSGG